jgi:hypothetical protein
MKQSGRQRVGDGYREHYRCCKTLRRPASRLDWKPGDAYERCY